MQYLLCFTAYQNNIDENGQGRWKDSRSKIMGKYYLDILVRIQGEKLSHLIVRAPRTPPNLTLPDELQLGQPPAQGQDPNLAQQNTCLAPVMMWWYLCPIPSLALPLANLSQHCEEFISWMSPSGLALPLTKTLGGPLTNCSSAHCRSKKSLITQYHMN